MTVLSCPPLCALAESSISVFVCPDPNGLAHRCAGADWGYAQPAMSFDAVTFTKEEAREPV